MMDDPGFDFDRAWDDPGAVFRELFYRELEKELEQGGISKCPVCRRFTHEPDCPVREVMRLDWTGASPDERAREAQS